MAQATNVEEPTFAEVEFAGWRDIDVMTSQEGIMWDMMR